MSCCSFTRNLWKWSMTRLALAAGAAVVLDRLWQIAGPSVVEKEVAAPHPRAGPSETHPGRRRLA